MRTSVDLPAPFGPMTQTISPGATENDTWVRAGIVRPKNRPRNISPNPAGGANDTFVRIIAARMSTILNASVGGDYRGGAGGTLGPAMVFGMLAGRAAARDAVDGVVPGP